MTKDLARATNDEIQEILFELSIGLTPQKALSAPKISDLVRDYDDKTTANLVVMVLRAAIESFGVSQQPNVMSLVQLAYDLVEKYPSESLEDFILALKNARLRGFKTYNSLSSMKLHEIFNDYFVEKSKFLENRHLDNKAAALGQDASVVAAIAAAPQVATMLKRRLDPTHPNLESLRRKLNITAAKEDRKIITLEQAEEQRAEVEAANYRHATRRQDLHQR